MGKRGWPKPPPLVEGSLRVGYHVDPVRLRAQERQVYLLLFETDSGWSGNPDRAPTAPEADALEVARRDVVNVCAGCPALAQTVFERKPSCTTADALFSLV